MCPKDGDKSDPITRIRVRNSAPGSAEQAPNDAFFFARPIGQQCTSHCPSCSRPGYETHERASFQVGAFHNASSYHSNVGPQAADSEEGTLFHHVARAAECVLVSYFRTLFDHFWTCQKPSKTSFGYFQVSVVKTDSKVSEVRPLSNTSTNSKNCVRPLSAASTNSDKSPSFGHFQTSRQFQKAAFQPQSDTAPYSLKAFGHLQT